MKLHSLESLVRSRRDLGQRLQAAVQSYWDVRTTNREKQVESGKIDAGIRGEVTGGTQMAALEALVADILCEAGSENLTFVPEHFWSCPVIFELRRSGI